MRICAWVLVILCYSVMAVPQSGESVLSFVQSVATDVMSDLVVSLG